MPKESFFSVQDNICKLSDPDSAKQVAGGKIHMDRHIAKETSHLFQTSCLQDPCIIVLQSSGPLSTVISRNMKNNTISIMIIDERT